MEKVRYFLLFLVLTNTFCLQHMAWTRALYQETQHISEENVLNQPEMNAKMDWTGKRNTNVNDQQVTDADTKKIENIMKLINMKFRTGKRNIRDSDQQITNLKEDENVRTLTKLRDIMEKRSFSSFAHQNKNRENGWYLKFFLHFALLYVLDKRTIMEAYRMMLLIKHLVQQGATAQELMSTPDLSQALN